MQDLKSKWESILSYVHETSLIESTIATLEWDEHNGIPNQAHDYRADQISLLSGYAHQRRTAQSFGEQLHELAASEWAADPNSPVGASIRGMVRDYEKNKLLPESLVRRISRAISIGQTVWAQAKQENDFAKFLPSLKEIVALRREESELLRRPDRVLYDGLLDQYEEGAKTSEVAVVFEDLRRQLVPLVRKSVEAAHRPNGKSVQGVFDVATQRRFSKWVAEEIGFDFSRGRLDETEHPFCTTLGPHDHRILTKYYEDSFASGLFGVLHEAGHGMYEQGLSPEYFGTPTGYAASLGVHESQSRLWENLVGRSHAFWKWCLPHAQKYFPQLQGADLDSVVADLNIVEPSLIRIEADEVTYNLHILIRFELEQSLIHGEIEAEQLPEAWSSKYLQYLGIQPPNDTQGVLQDVHWSAGLIGYFPTYTLGNIFASQLFEAADRDLGGLEEMIEKGEFKPLLDWLRAKIHIYGRRFTPNDLIERAVGAPISSKPLIKHLATKIERYYV